MQCYTISETLSIEVLTHRSLIANVSSYFGSVRLSYGSGVEAVFKFVCPLYDVAEVFTRGQQVKQMMSRVIWVFCYCWSE